MINPRDKFTFKHPDYPNSGLIGKELIAGEVTEEYVERFEQHSLVIKRYPIQYCTKIEL